MKMFGAALAAIDFLLALVDVIIAAMWWEAFPPFSWFSLTAAAFCMGVGVYILVDAFTNGAAERWLAPRWRKFKTDWHKSWTENP